MFCHIEDVDKKCKKKEFVTKNYHFKMLDRALIREYN